MIGNKPIKKIDSFIEKWQHKDGNLIMILHDIQDYYGFVPKEEAYKLSQSLNIPLARIYEVLTFYNYFNLNPPGQHKISICMGTACYLKGAPELIRQFSHILNIKENETTADGKFQLSVVRCLGCCGLAPVVMVNDKIYGGVKKSDVKKILADFKK